MINRTNLESGDFIRNKLSIKRFTVEKIFGDSIIARAGCGNDRIISFDILVTDYEIVTGKSKKTSRPYCDVHESDNIVGYQTSSGREVEIVTLSGRGKRPIKGYIDDNEHLSTWYPNGRSSCGQNSRNDLHVITEVEVFEPIVISTKLNKSDISGDLSIDDIADAVVDILEKRLKNKLIRKQ